MVLKPNRWLLPLAWPYAGLMGLRAKSYARGWLSSWRPQVPTLSVGNIGWGGSGKTPLCQWIMTWSLRRNLQPLVLTRGYRAKPDQYPYLVQPDSSAGSAGDEPLMLFRACPGALVLVDPKRSRAGRWGWQSFSPDLFILDDGFQHLGVQRDLDLVLLRAQDLQEEWNRVIPSGSWREGTTALKRATAFCIKASPDAFRDLSPTIHRRLGPLHKPIFSFDLYPTGFLRTKDRTRQAQLPGNSYLLISGVGNPQQIEDTATQALGKKPGAHLVFPDHHPYTFRDWQRIMNTADSLGGVPRLCTPKDSVKLERFKDENLWTFDLELTLGPALCTDVDFPGWLEQRLCQTSSFVFPAVPRS